MQHDRQRRLAPRSGLAVWLLCSCYGYWSNSVTVADTCRVLLTIQQTWLSCRASFVQVRQLLYGPSSYHLSLYPQLLVGEPKQPLDMSVSANKVQAITLCQLWLVHGRCWERMSVFIQAGGLK